MAEGILIGFRRCHPGVAYRSERARQLATLFTCDVTTTRRATITADGTKVAAGE